MTGNIETKNMIPNRSQTHRHPGTMTSRSINTLILRWQTIWKIIKLVAAGIIG